MLSAESHEIEFKEIYTPEIKKEVIAFANTEGGKILVGIRADGTVIGLEDPDDTMLKITSSLRDNIRPDVLSFVQVRSVLIEEKTVVEISVQIGTSRPYYLRDKGLKPSGVYVRRGSASLPVNEETIRQMIIETNGKSYENCRSMDQDLSFAALQEEMKKRSIKFGPAQMQTLHMIGEDGLYTNLAKLLSDQCDHTIKAAVFQGSEKEIFRSRKEFSGSLLKQLKEVYDLIDLHNQTKATFSGLDRTDKRDYPPEAVREALLNCIVHRDYAFSGSTLINIYEDRIEFISLGGLVQGLSLEAVFMGVSQSRNPNLAAIFYRMGLIESYGTGISKIMRLYRSEAAAPQFDTAKGVFRVILPNCNEKAASAVTETLPIEPVEDFETCVPPLSNKDKVVQYVISHGGITRREAEALLSAKSTKAYTLLKSLCEEGVLTSEGSSRSRVYRLVKS